MSSVAPPGAEAERVSTGDSIRDWVASLLRYAELRLRLLGLESKDAGLHLLILAILFASTVALFAGFLLMFAVFLLYLIITLLHWEWGWGALLCSGIRHSPARELHCCYHSPISHRSTDFFADPR